ncbi:MAG: metal-dependent hydrolase [Xanthomonadaceae bacterium]|nr:metal-dependent hydrolase [Xanthomonadaceae bacterium]
MLSSSHTMDNLTHTLIGITVAHSLPKKLRTREIYWASVIANNLPDSDVIQNFFPGTTPLDYLVHHRGYTHNFFLTFGLAYAGAALTSFIAKPKGERKVTRELYLFTLLGCFMHIGADFMNSYGVHPFSPLFNQWLYGDSVFIIEPWIWMILLPMAIAMAHSKSAKIFWSVLLAVGWGIIGFVDYVTLPIKIGVTLAGAFSFWFHHKKKTANLAAVSLLTVITAFFTFSHIAKNEIRTTSHAPFNDIEATPSPGNPFCWGSWSEKSEGEDHVMRLALVTPFPNIVGADQCGAWRTVYPRSGNPHLIDRPDEKNPSVLWRYESRVSKQDYDDLYEHSCQFQRLMSFVRFPYVTHIGKNWAAGDLRYDMRDRGNFTHMEITDESSQVANCEAHNAPWASPFRR